MLTGKDLANAVTAMFLMRGYSEAAAQHESVDGELEFAYEMAQWAPVAREVGMGMLAAVDHSAPGVWEYEVAEPLGAALYHAFMKGTPMDQEQVEAKTAELTLGFMRISPLKIVRAIEKLQDMDYGWNGSRWEGNEPPLPRNRIAAPGGGL